MSKPTKRIAIIGAGASGITAARQCLDAGLAVVIYERSNYIGGLWRYQDEVRADGTASVMKSTVINTSKEMSAFSNFPPPEEWPNFMHNTKMVAYLDAYADSFSFREHVQLNTEIVSIQMTPDYPTSGQWAVTYCNLLTKTTATELFDGVMICTGHHGTPNYGKIPGIEVFKGSVMHTHDLKSGAGFEGKNVLVIGIGNSGGDAAVEVSGVAKKVYLSTRRGSWLFHRLGATGLPFDTYFLSRIVHWALWWLPFWISCTLLEWYLNTFVDHERYQLKPKHRCLAQHALVNDALPNRIMAGLVVMKGDIERVVEDGVVFKGEETAISTPIDVIILATGYRFAFPLLGKDLLPIVETNQVHLYQHVFLPHIPHPETLAFIGLVQPLGSLFTVSEMQARWYAELNRPDAKLQLPSQKAMDRSILKTERRLKARFYESARHTVEVDWIGYLDHLARKIGAYPPLWWYFFTSPRLYLTLVFGPSATYQYRLVGPGAWSGARQAILGINRRIRAPLKTNFAKKRSSNWLTNLSCLSAVVMAFIGAMMASSVATFVALKLYDLYLEGKFFNFLNV